MLFYNLKLCVTNCYYNFPSHLVCTKLLIVMQKKNATPSAAPSVNQSATWPAKSLEDSSKISSSSTGRAKFIFKLHVAICKYHGGGIVTWSLDGSYFTVNNPVEFAKTIMPTFCSGKTFNSFERQIHFYS